MTMHDGFCDIHLLEPRTAKPPRPSFLLGSVHPLPSSPFADLKKQSLVAH